MSKQDYWFPSFGTPVSDWYRAFALFPTWTLDRGVIWMRRYWKRTIVKHEHLDGGPDFWTQKAVMKND